MLKEIQNMINRKQAFAEAAAIIFEDVTEGALDNLIILGEAEEPVEEPIAGEEENEENLGDAKKDDEVPTEEGDDLLDKPVGEPAPAEETPPMDDTSLPSTDIDGGDDLTGATLGNVPEPEPEVAPEGELNADDDLLNVSINLATNTLNDVLPIPPANAGEAIGGEEEGDDLLSSRVDSGFGDEEGAANPVPAPEDDGGAGLEQVDDILKEDVNNQPEKKPEDKGSAASVIMNSKMSDSEKVKAMGKLFGEGINLGGDSPAAEETVPTATAGDAPAEGELPADPTAPEGEESDVTAAVRDKVSEVDDGLGGEGGLQDPKTEILDKLDSLNRNILNAKETVKKLLQ